jgi:hypothetical protein
MVKSATPAEVAVYAEEVPSYLEGRSLPGELFDRVLAEAVPELGQARTRVRVAHKERAVLRHDAAKLHRQIHEGRRSEVPLVDPRNVTAQRYA